MSEKVTTKPTSEKVILANRENAKLGGRKESEASIVARMYRDALAREVDAHHKEIVTALVLKCIDGDVNAIREMHDRLLGKPQQAVNVTGAVENFFTFARDVIDVVHTSSKTEDQLTQTSEYGYQLEENTETTRSVGVFDE